MSDNYNNENLNRSEIENYRRQKAAQFKLNISDDTSRQEPVSDFTDEITSFSDETTKAQIERDSKKAL